MKVNGLTITVKRSKRKTVSIFVERDGSVSARVPASMEEEELAEIVRNKEYLIHKHLAEWEQLNHGRIEREYVSGQSFLYLGRNYRLRLVDESLEGLLLRNGRFLLPRTLQSQAKEQFVAFYKAKLKEKLPPIVAHHQARLGVAPHEVKVLELHHRWASCTATGNLNFHWKCAMAPIDVLHYIVAHELTHLIHPNHTSSFWNELDKIMPDYQRRHEWLKANGAGMDL